MTLTKLLHNWNGLTKIIFIGPLFSKKNISFIEKDAGLVFIDGGSAFKSDFHSNKTQFFVGDGDSSHPDQYFDLKLSPQKDLTDLEVALSLLPDHLFELELWGFLGGRLDHELANYGAVAQFLIEREHTQIVSFDQRQMLLSPGAHQLTLQGPFSLLALMETQLHLEGSLSYSTAEPITLLPFTGRGLSNISHGKFELTTSGPLLLWRETT